ncbi:universal stress protein [Gymnodinialimonas ulvae]|uniref:universal stress protein n=1 Tax=Gymnodinialimonas ulvae TaxID=3126504 RepID=UPI00309F1974
MTQYTLAAIDLAHPAHHALILAKAAQLADMEGNTLAVVTVIPDFGMSIVGSFFQDGAEQKALEEANQALHKVTEDVLGPDLHAQIKHMVCHGTAYEQILNIAGEIGAAQIVMAAHRPDFQDYLIGSTAARVARHAKCSVTILRA